MKLQIYIFEKTKNKKYTKFMFQKRRPLKLPLNLLILKEKLLNFVAKDYRAKKLRAG